MILSLILDELFNDFFRRPISFKLDEKRVLVPSLESEKSPVGSVISRTCYTELHSRPRTTSLYPVPALAPTVLPSLYVRSLQGPGDFAVTVAFVSV